MYEYETRIRYSEVNSDGILSLPALLDYFQDCSIFHSENIGLGISYLEEHHLLWALGSWQIVIHRCPKMGEVVTVGTAPYDFKGFIGYRNFWMKDKEGNQIACANSLWSLLDTEKGKPAKLNEDMVKGYQLSEKLDMEYEGRHIHMEGEEKGYPYMIVKPHNLDTNLHVNNGQYVRIALDYLTNEELLHIRQLRAEYKMQAKLDTRLYPKRYDYNGKIGIKLQDEDEKSYCNMEFDLFSYTL